MRSTAARQFDRHPFIYGAIIVLLGPYILAAALLFIVGYAIAVALDMALDMSR